ncbi:catalase family protein [Bacillus sp. NP157]|nr:catalase family protein [Bacillus sp. NP157]
MTSTPGRPIAYSPSLEHIEDDEAEVNAKLIEQMEKIGDIVREHTGHSYRSVHAKSHGLLVGRLAVHEALPLELAQGLFADPGAYDVVMRFSTPPGDLLNDGVSLPRAVAFKVLGVDGARVDASSTDRTQDFVMVNGPAFVKKNAKQFLKNVTLLASTTDKAEGFKKGLSTALRGVEKAIEAVGTKSAAILSMGGHPETQLLGETFFTQVPLRHGDYVAKFSLAPVSPELKALTGQPLDVDGHPDALRESVIDFFRTHGGTWELRAQLLTDTDKMPIEDGAVEWPEDLSPYVTVATLTVQPQSAWNEERIRAIDDGLSFNPWHALAAHQPLGNVMRARRVVYDAMSRRRHSLAGVQHGEPSSLESIGLANGQGAHGNRAV